MARVRKYRLEKDVKKHIKELLDKHGWFWWMPAANGYGRAGISDFAAIRGGVFLAVEAKFGSNKPTVQQKAFLTSIAAETGIAYVVSDKNIEWFEGWLSAFDRAMDRASQHQPEDPDDGAYMINALRELTKDYV